MTQGTSGASYNPLRYYVVPKAEEQAGQGEVFNTLAEAQQRLRQLGSAWTIVSRRD